MQRSGCSHLDLLIADLRRQGANRDADSARINADLSLQTSQLAGKPDAARWQTDSTREAIDAARADVQT